MQCHLHQEPELWHAKPAEHDHCPFSPGRSRLSAVVTRCCSKPAGSTGFCGTLAEEALKVSLLVVFVDRRQGAQHGNTSEDLAAEQPEERGKKQRGHEQRWEKKKLGRKKERDIIRNNIIWSNPVNMLCITMSLMTVQESELGPGKCQLERSESLHRLMQLIMTVLSKSYLVHCKQVFIPAAQEESFQVQNLFVSQLHRPEVHLHRHNWNWALH